MVNLGSKVKDSLTGFEGVAIARIIHLYGCVHIAILPTNLKDGVPQRERVFDEQRVEVIEKHDRAATEPKVPLGALVRDRITGLQGVVTTWVDELNNAPMVSVTSTQLHEGKPIDGITLSEGRVEILEVNAPQVSEDSSATSGSIVGEIPLSGSKSWG